jgi:triosephosphate isomerase (TIM)
VSRKPIIAGNWKCYHHHLTALQVVQKLSYLLEPSDYEATEVVVCPAFTALRTVQTTIQSDRMKIVLGAQNVYWEPEGAFTGEVSAPMLAKLDVAYVIVGHSERRQLFDETDEWVNRKAKAVLANGMVPIVCVGETLDQREAGETDAHVAAQVRAGFAGIDPADVARCVIAYEPIWAIGTGRTATPDDANATIGVIRAAVDEAFGGAVSAALRIQYGGSVKAANAADLMAMPEIDGALVGGASLDPDEFARIVRYRHG